ncbi:GNAT family N-acetyltransferase [Ktedonosporobacter rubrisoli]|uniref:GNAT family N-acetyltransferase n=1 Tax=Ktedonosporobacter rubrisoli TaxID=2509675 RepID=A0A4P6JKS7_KTERU|nr:GNAT family N-acetyltransferase [Ktedonosporobacter rubrisoli]QBD75779.1 GNAT family N-acetyltransferase [Ktedonosporobacter rubrisoli]
MGTTRLSCSQGESRKEELAIDNLLRTARPDEYEAICTLYAELVAVHTQALPQFFQPSEIAVRPFSEETFHKILASQQDTIFVAEQQGLLVGFVRCYVHTTPVIHFVVQRRFVYVEDIVVSKAVQHQGVGRALMERVQAWARELEISEIELDVWEFPTSARSFYEQLGYQTTKQHMRKVL